MTKSRVQRLGAAIAVSVATALSLSGCGLSTTSEPQPKVSASPTATVEVPDTPLAEFYSQQAKWGKCAKFGGEGIQCATIKVPLDYAKPKGKTISLVIARDATSGTGSKQVLLLNPGGPGGSGVKFLESASERMISDEVKEHFTLASFDPRGVGQSQPIRCLSDQETDAFRSDQVGADSKTEIDRFKKQLQDYGQKCLKKNGELLSHVSTVEAAKDMDIIRVVLGQKKLNFLGYSYGTYLGATYADLFPKHVGRMVLDGVLSSGYDIAQVAAAQAQGFQKSLEHFIEQCANASGCPLGNNVADAKKNLREFIDGLAKTPLQTQDPKRPLTQSLAYEGIFGPLYAEVLYPQLRQALTQAIKHHDGTQLLSFADLYADRNADGTYETNQMDAFMAINALDYDMQGTPEQWQKDAEELKKKFPLSGEVFGFAPLQQSVWPAKAANGRNKRQELKAEGAPPILMVANTHDPATPLASAKNAAKLMKSARLITWDSYTHTAYGWGSRCVQTAVDDYLIKGKLPEAGLACTD